jgi:hypothetical protein
VRSSIDYAGVAINIRFNNHSQNVAMFRTYQNCAMRYLFQGRNFLTEGSDWLGASDICLGRGPPE